MTNAWTGSVKRKRKKNWDWKWIRRSDNKTRRDCLDRNGHGLEQYYIGLKTSDGRCVLVTSSDGIWDWWETGEICWVPKRVGVSRELGGSKGVEWCRGRVTAKGSHSLVATVRSSPGRITSGSGVAMTWDSGAWPFQDSHQGFSTVLTSRSTSNRR